MYREIRSYANSIWDDNNNNNRTVDTKCAGKGKERRNFARFGLAVGFRQNMCASGNIPDRYILLYNRNSSTVSRKALPCYMMSTLEDKRDMSLSYIPALLSEDGGHKIPGTGTFEGIQVGYPEGCFGQNCLYT